MEFYGSLCAFATMRQPLIHSTNGAWKPKCVRDRNLDPGSGSKKVWDELLCGHVHATYVRISVCVCVFVCFPTVPARRQCAKSSPQRARRDGWQRCALAAQSRLYDYLTTVDLLWACRHEFNSQEMLIRSCYATSRSKIDVQVFVHELHKPVKI